MLVELAYGKDGLDVELPDDWQVQIIEPVHLPGLQQPLTAIRRALRQPNAGVSLASLVDAGTTIGIILNDITRATPSSLLLDAILAELSDIPDSHITLFIALGTHRPNTKAELAGILGEKYLDRFKIVQNNAFDRSSQVQIGVTRRGHPIWINRHLLNCDLKILTGFIEPHFFAGYSGGGKAVMPGMAGLDTILANHGADMIAGSNATWGITTGNPIWEEIQEIAGLIGNAFLLNVALNRDQEVTAVFTGNPYDAIVEGCSFVSQHAMQPVTQLFDIVVTSNSGFPLDLNLYQTVKGISAAARIVRQGGAIIAASECWDGLPEHGRFAELLQGAQSPQGLLARIMQPSFQMHDQWQAQILAQIMTKADIYIFSEGLSETQLQQAMLKKSYHIEDTLADLLKICGREAKIAVLPQGPLTVPYLSLIHI